MKYTLFLVIIMISVHSPAICINKIEFISQFLHYKNILKGSYITCWNHKENLQALKVNAQNNILSRFITTDHLSNYKFVDFQNNYHNKVGYVLDTSCDKWRDILEKVTELKFATQHRWFLLHEKISENQDIYSALKEMKIRLDFKIYVAQRDGDSYYIYEAYNPGFNKGGKVFKLNTINYTQGIFIEGNTSWYDSRKDLSSLDLRILFFLPTNQSNPLAYLEDQRNKHEDTFVKISYAIFKHVEEIHQFSWTPIFTTTFFAASPHDADEGLGKMLLEDDIDMCMVAGLVTKPRINIVHYFIKVYTYRSQFVYRRGGVHGQIQNVIFKPFSNICWLCILLLTLILLSFVFLEIHLEYHLNNLCEEFITSVTYVMSVFCQQGIPLKLKYYAGRVLIFCFLMFSLLLCNYYTSSIVSSLINYQEQPLKTLGQLMNSKLNIGLQNSSYIITYFQANRNLTAGLHLLGEQIFSNNSRTKFLSPYEGIVKVKAGGFAYHCQSTSLYKYLADVFDDAEICETAGITVLSDRSVHLMSSKHNQYNKLLSISYAKIVQVGLLQRLQKLWDIPKPQCRTGQFVQVGFEQAAPALLILLAGIVVAFTLLLLEKLYSVWRG